MIFEYDFTTMTEKDIFEMKLKDIEKEIVLRTLRECDGNRTKTAHILGVSRRWLQYQLKNWDI